MYKAKILLLYIYVCVCVYVKASRVVEETEAKTTEEEKNEL